MGVRPMRIAVTGSGGMLGQDLLPALATARHDVVALDSAALDVTDTDAVRDRIAHEKPDAVIQCAAYTAVDAAETGGEAEAFRVNAEGARNVARACAEVGALFVYPSTDYVFSAPAERPRRPEDPVAPLNAYGRSKLAGEEAAREAPRHLIVRTSWLYGRGGANFVDTITRLAGERESLDVVDDQVGIPTWTASLARTLAALLRVGAEGVLHATDGGPPVTWYGFAREIARLRGLSVRLVPVPTSGFPRPARRPRYSVLDCSRTESLLGARLPDWRTMLAEYVAH
jgi:dTDP-4-dehydrorhamnose reductase